MGNAQSASPPSPPSASPSQDIVVATSTVAAVLPTNSNNNDVKDKDPGSSKVVCADSSQRLVAVMQEEELSSLEQGGPNNKGNEEKVSEDASNFKGHADGTDICTAPAPPSPSTKAATVKQRRRRKDNDNDEEDPFDIDLRFAIAAARAAFRYGSSGATVERFLEEKCLHKYPFALARLTQSELFVTVARRIDDRFGESSIPIQPVTIIVRAQSGLDLKRLSDLISLVQNWLHKRMDTTEALVGLEGIAKAPPQYGTLLQLINWIGVGASLAPLLGGSWVDVPAASLLSGVAFLVTTAFTFLPRPCQRFDMLVLAFTTGTLATSIKVGFPNINVTLVTLSSVAIPLPGFTVSLGVAELAANRVVSGFANLLQGILCLFWLALGGYLGATLVRNLVTIPEADNVAPVAGVWQALWIPLLACGLNVCFQVPRQDFLWGFVIMGLTYASSFGFSQWTANANLGVLLSSVVMTVVSNAWSRYFNRPNIMVLKPAKFFKYLAA